MFFGDRQFWLDLVQRWNHSGLSKAANCEKHRIKTGSFNDWSSKTSTITSNDVDTFLDLTPALPNFLPVKVTASHGRHPVLNLFTWSVSSGRICCIFDYLGPDTSHAIGETARVIEVEGRFRRGLEKFRRVVVDIHQQ